MQHTQGKAQKEIEEDDLLVDSILFRVIQIAENSMKLDEVFQNRMHIFLGEQSAVCGI